MRGGYRPVLGAIGHPAAGVALIGHQRGTVLYASDGSSRRVRCAHAIGSPMRRYLPHHTGHRANKPSQTQLASTKFVKQAKLYRTWGDCFGYFAVATGAADLMLDPQLGYWDVAAIVPVIEGAGGVVTSWSGGDPLVEPSLIASAGALHPIALSLLGS